MKNPEAEINIPKYTSEIELKDIEQIKEIKDIGSGIVLDLFYSLTQYHYQSNN